IEKASQLFEEEAKRLEVLGKNPQIPQLLDYFVTDKGQQYLVQEYIDGENLQQELTSRGEFYREAEVRKILIDILNILKFVHENHVIHRDIKPENLIRRNSDQKLVLVDFGAAKYIHSQTALGVTGTVIGSAQYCASEQARGKAVFASDLYSLGVVCIYLLTLVEPFQLFDTSENDWVWRDYLGKNRVSDQFGQVLDQLIVAGLKKRFANVDQVLKSLNDQPKKTSVSAKIPNAVKPNKKSIPAKKSKPAKLTNNRISNTVTSAKISIFANYEKVELFFTEKISFIAKLTNNKISNSPLSNKISVSSPYEKLEKYLANGEWKAADNETSKLILKLVGVENLTLELMVGETQGWLNDELIEKIPYSGLCEIDRLWLTYSDGRFGFSVQKNIWLSQCGGQVDKYNYKAIEKLGDFVGWRKQGTWDIEGVKFTISAPPGHLPLVPLVSRIMIPLFPFIVDWFPCLSYWF
ncbi:MAG: GUN4 domain-containing protein, partial [Microcoleaceae cyanobacterium]